MVPPCEPDHVVDRFGRSWPIRQLRADDGRVLSAYFEALTAADYANFHPHPLDGAAAETIAADAASADALRLLLVADAAGGEPVVGYGFLWSWDESEPLLGMSLAAVARGRGLGAAFTRYLVERAAAVGKSGVRLTVYRDNLPAYHSYLRAGFAEEGSAADEWGGRVREEVRMYCALRSGAPSYPGRGC